MPHITIIGHGVTFAGAVVKIGDTIEVSEKSYAALVAEGLGTSPDGQEDHVETLNGSDGSTPDKVPNDGLGAVLDPSEDERMRKALNDQYNLEPGNKPGLKDAAAAAGVDFPFDVTKGVLIDLIVAQGKAADLVK